MGGAAFKVFTRAQLATCQALGETYFCPNNNDLDKRIETNCVLGLYNLNEEVITANCPWKTVTATDFAVQLGSNKFLLYHSNNKDAQLVCGKTLVTKSSHGLKQLHVTAGCQLFSESYVMEEQTNFSLMVSTFIKMDVRLIHGFVRLLPASR
jgi:hypothetical protein